MYLCRECRHCVLAQSDGICAMPKYAVPWQKNLLLLDVARSARLVSYPNSAVKVYVSIYLRGT